jgi:hypothetical protein
MLRSAPELPATVVMDSGPAPRGASRNDESFFVNAMFTTFVRVRFTNVFVCTAPIPANPCVWRACIAD